MQLSRRAVSQILVELPVWKTIKELLKNAYAVWQFKQRKRAIETSAEKKMGQE